MTFVDMSDRAHEGRSWTLPLNRALPRFRLAPRRFGGFTLFLRSSRSEKASTLAVIESLLDGRIRLVASLPSSILNLSPKKVGLTGCAIIPYLNS